MRRAVQIGFGVAALAGVLILGRREINTGDGATALKVDSVWYHASDVALLATTGRPQLVEFFHPS